MDAYRTLRGDGRDEIVIQKSRFICDAAPAQTEEEALAVLRRAKETWRDARHHCYAYIIGRNAGIMRYSDDGEPGGTAGLPMMEVLRKSGVVNCCAVVTRYFGGILLGAGGLVRAYTQAAAAGLQAAGIVTMERSRSCLCEVAYPLWDRVQYHMRSLPVQVRDTAFAAAVSFTVVYRTQDEERVLASLTSVCEGQIEFLPEDEAWMAWDA